MDPNANEFYQAINQTVSDLKSMCVSHSAKIFQNQTQISNLIQDINQLKEDVKLKADDIKNNNKFIKNEFSRSRANNSLSINDLHDKFSSIERDNLNSSNDGSNKTKLVLDDITGELTEIELQERIEDLKQDLARSNSSVINTSRKGPGWLDKYRQPENKNKTSRIPENFQERKLNRVVIKNPNGGVIDLDDLREGNFGATVQEHPVKEKKNTISLDDLRVKRDSFKCQLCSKEYDDISELQRHSKKHEKNSFQDDYQDSFPSDFIKKESKRWEEEELEMSEQKIKKSLTKESKTWEDESKTWEDESKAWEDESNAWDDEEDEEEDNTGISDQHIRNALSKESKSEDGNADLMSKSKPAVTSKSDINKNTSSRPKAISNPTKPVSNPMENTETPGEEAEKLPLLLPGMETYTTISKEHKILKKTLACKECPFKTRKRIEFDEHVKNSCTRQLPTCSECQGVYPSKYHLKQHIDTEHKNRPDSYACDQCPFISKKSYLLLNHVKFKHLKEYEFQCDKCLFVAPTNTKLKYHIKWVHDKIRDWQCQECAQFYSTKYNLDMHMKTVHWGIKMYSCQTCYYQTNQKGYLRVHLQQEHGINEFTGNEKNEKFWQEGKPDNLELERNLSLPMPMPGALPMNPLPNLEQTPNMEQPMGNMPPMNHMPPTPNINALANVETMHHNGGSRAEHEENVYDLPDFAL